jgi:hypothetical protein
VTNLEALRDVYRAWDRVWTFDGDRVVRVDLAQDEDVAVEGARAAAGRASSG